MTRVDGDSGHGGADFVGDGVLVTDEAGCGETELWVRSPAVRKKAR